MKNFLYRIDIKKVALVFIVLIMAVSLTGCMDTGMYEVPLNGFTDETNPFGWLLLWPIGWLMNTIGSVFGDSFGWGLVFTTLIVRTLAWPIYAGSNNTMFKMQLAQEDMNKVQSKYQGRNDPQSKQRMSMEMQAIYKKHGINVLGCLAVPLQMPIFSAMYTVIKRIQVEGGALTLTNMNFLGFDLGASLFEGGVKNQIFNGVLTAIVVGLMIGQQKIMQKKPSYAKNIPNKNPQAEQMQKQMKYMMYLMPLMMASIAAQDSGMALYWVVGTAFQIMQCTVTKKLQEKKYKKLHPDQFIDPKELKEAKILKEKERQQREIIDVTSSEETKN